MAKDIKYVLSGENDEEVSGQFRLKSDMPAEQETGEATTFRQPISIRPNKRFNTYQVRLALYPAGQGATVHDCWGKAILHVTSYLEYKLSKESTGTALYENIASYGKVEDYKAFDIESITMRSFEEPMRLKTLYDRENATWAICYEEPDGGLRDVPDPDGGSHDEEGVPGRTFVMDVSIRELDECVAVGIRCVCHEPSSSPREVRVIRPHFVKMLAGDDAMDVTEYGIPARFAFHFDDKNEAPERIAIPVNTKNDTDCREFIEGLVNNENRQLPILMYYVQDNGDEFENAIRKLLKDLPGYVYPVILRGSGKKILKQENGGAFYTEGEMGTRLIEGGELVWYRRTAKRAVAETVYFSGKESEAQYATPGGTVEILNEVRQDMKNRQMDFAPCEFYTELNNRAAEKKLREMIGGEQPEVIEKMNEVLEEKDAQIEDLESAVSAFSTWFSMEEERNKKLSAEIEKLKKSAKEKDRVIAKYSGQEDRDIVDQGDIRSLKKEKEALEKELERLKESKSAGMDANFVKNIYKPLLALSEIKKDADFFARWIEENYSETLILHPDAKREITGKDIISRDVDFWKRMYYSIHYLHGITLMRRGAEIEPELYDPLAYGFVDGSVGGATDIKKFEDQYKIDISAYNTAKGRVTMNLHVKYMGSIENQLRVYYYYDKDIKKSIIGYMPKHLDNLHTAKS